MQKFYLNSSRKECCSRCDHHLCLSKFLDNQLSLILNTNDLIFELSTNDNETKRKTVKDAPKPKIKKNIKSSSFKARKP